MVNRRRSDQYQQIDGIEAGGVNDANQDDIDNTANTAIHNYCYYCGNCANYANCANCTNGWFNLSGNVDCKFLTFFLFYMMIFVLTFTSLNFIKYDQYALTRNKLGTVYKSPILTQGVYPLFPIYATVIFPSTLNEVNFKSTVFSDTGLQFVMQIWSCYELPKDNIYDIYNKFSNSYDLRVQSISKKTIKNLAAIFSVNDFLKNRTYIEKVIAEGVYMDLLNEMSVISPPEYFKITDIIFPQNIIDNSLQSAIALQNNQLQENQQYVQVVSADTAKIVASINAQTDKMLQNSVAESNKIISSSKYIFDKIIDSARSEGIKIATSSIGITGSLVIDFVNVISLIDNSLNKTILHNIGGSPVILNT